MRSVLGDNQGSISDYSKAINLDPKSDFTYNNRGLIYSKLGQYDLAINDYFSAINLNDTNSIAYNNRGNAYFYLGKYDLAIEDFTQAIRGDRNLVVSQSYFCELIKFRKIFSAKYLEFEHPQI